MMCAKESAGPAKQPNPYLRSQLKAAVELWDQVRGCPYPADRFLGNYFHQFRKKFGSRDRRFLSEITYALFRHRTFLEVWAQVCHQEDPFFLILLAGASEGLLDAEIFDQLVKEFFPKLISMTTLYESVQSRKLPEALEKKSTPEEILSLRYSFPLWLVQKWIHHFGIETAEKMLEASQKRPPFVIRTNTLKISRKKLLEKLHHKGWPVAAALRSEIGITFKERSNLFDTEEFREGLFEVQDEGSQIVSSMIEAQPGEVIWDVCAGGGGKTLAMAAAMQNKGRIIATDIRPAKLDDLRKRTKRAGVNNVFPADLNRLDETAAMKKGLDKIVIDAPCSGTGTLRRNPDAKWKLRPETFEANHKEQAAIFEKKHSYLKDGGRIFYITCSLEPEENENVIAEILKKDPSWTIVPYARSKDGFFRLSPWEHGTDGFFLAILEKTIKNN